MIRGLRVARLGVEPQFDVYSIGKIGFGGSIRVIQFQGSIRL